MQKELAEGVDPSQINAYLRSNPDIEPDLSSLKQNSILSQSGPITENFGDYMPNLEPTPSGKTTGAGIGVPTGTKVALPPGKWDIADSYNQAQGAGYIGNMENKGYGNSVLARNSDSGEWLRLSHLSANFAKPGQQLDGNTIIGMTGATGNTTGPHIHMEYYDPQGQVSDIMQSPYGKYVPVQGQQ
jgi:murein DD-endopeptidase MepM/ murein hydrolase activator NlpD